MTNEEYQKIGKLSCSGMKRILKNAREFHLWQEGNIEDDSYEMDIGTIYHAAMLEPDKVNDMFEIAEPLSDNLKKYLPYFKQSKFVDYGEDVHRNTKLFKLAKAELSKDTVLLLPSEIQILSHYCNSGKIFLTSEDVEMINRMVVKTKKLPVIEDYLQTGEKELVIFGDIDGVDIKCRLDLLKKHPSGAVSILDLKTTFRDASPASFAKDSANNDWYIQDALYREISRQNYDGVDSFTFVFTSKEEWSGAGFYRHEQIDIDTGVEKIKQALTKYKRCKEQDIWPESKFDYEEEKFQVISTVKLPSYVWYKYLD